MIDPDGIQITTEIASNKIDIEDIPVCDYNPYNLESEKEYKKYIGDIEKAVRGRYEYRQFIRYIRDYMGMNKCAYLKGVTNQESFDIKIEIHHYPFTLMDICEIVYRKRKMYNESLSVNMVAKEVMSLHYKLIIGLIPLSETVHELYHNGKLFIPIDKVLGRYKIFIEYYKPFCTVDQLDILERIEKYTEEQSDILNTTIIDQNRVTYNFIDESFKLPEVRKIIDSMIEQIKNIKNNNYLLPTVDEMETSNSVNNKEKICPVEFSNSEEKKYICCPIEFK